MWIEISHPVPDQAPNTVTPFTGVWIEIRRPKPADSFVPVTPFTGVWIEIPPVGVAVKEGMSHTLHGCVD